MMQGEEAECHIHCDEPGPQRRIPVPVVRPLPGKLTIIQFRSFISPSESFAKSLYRCVPGVAVYFGSFEALKTLWVEEDRQLRAADGFALGATARCVAAILLIPFTVIKTRFEVST